MKKPKPALTRAGGTWTEARFWSFLRSALRRAFVRWPANYQARNAARRPAQGGAPRLKWQYKCSMCGKWFPAKETQLHHTEECGQLKDFSDLPVFVERLFCEADKLALLCKPCHKNTHHEHTTKPLRDAG